MDSNNGEFLRLLTTVVQTIADMQPVLSEAIERGLDASPAFTPIGVEFQTLLDKFELIWLGDQADEETSVAEISQILANLNAHVKEATANFATITDGLEVAAPIVSGADEAFEKLKDAYGGLEADDQRADTTDKKKTEFFAAAGVIVQKAEKVMAKIHKVGEEILAAVEAVKKIAVVPAKVEEAIDDFKKEKLDKEDALQKMEKTETERLFLAVNEYQERLKDVSTPFDKMLFDLSAVATTITEIKNILESLFE